MREAPRVVDPIFNIPQAVQGKLLGVLQDREFYRVGGHTPIKTDVRIIAATDRDLEEMTAVGRFRSDLYYRIKVVELQLPPLRERGRTDIERVAHHLETVAARRLGRSAPGFSREALVRLADHSWPGNVRELENSIESALIVMEGERIEAGDLPLPVLPAVNKGTGPATSTDSFPTLDEIERTHIQRALERAHQNQSEAARLLGISRNILARKIKN